MELLVKLYQDKPSRLAIKYLYEYQAVKAYEALLHKIPDRFAQVSFEIVRQKITLTFQSEQTGAKVIYKDLDYKADQLRKFLSQLQSKQDLIFVHVFSKASTLMVAKAFHRQDFVAVSTVRLLGELQNAV